MKPLWEPFQVEMDILDRIKELNMLDSITAAEGRRIGKCFRMGLILVTYDGPNLSEIPNDTLHPSWCIAKETCSFHSILQTLKHLA